MAARPRVVAALAGARLARRRAARAGDRAGDRRREPHHGRVLHRSRAAGAELRRRASCSAPIWWSISDRPIDTAFDGEARERGLRTVRHGALSQHDAARRADAAHRDQGGRPGLSAQGPAHHRRRQAAPCKPSERFRRPARCGSTSGCWRVSTCSIGDSIALGAREFAIAARADPRSRRPASAS